MALEYAHGSFEWLISDAVASTKTISGLSFQPKALRFHTNGLQSATDAVSGSVSPMIGIGVAVSTSSRYCVNTSDVVGNSAQTCNTQVRDDCCVTSLNSADALDLDIINSDGFRMIVDNEASQDVTVFWEAWGGSDITVATIQGITEPAATGNVDYTVTGFTAAGTDQVVMLAFCSYTSTVPGLSATADGGISFGYATSGNTANNIVVTGNSDDGSTTMDTDGFCQTGKCVALIVNGGGNVNTHAQLTQFNTDGFRLNWGATANTARKGFALAIKGGNWTAGAYTIAGNSAGATATVSGLSYAPKGLDLMGRMSVAQGTTVSATQHRISRGVGTSTTDRAAMGALIEDATANVEVDLTLQYDQVLAFPSTTGTLQAAYDINAMNSDGFQIIVDTAGGVASEWQGYLTWGDAGGGTTTDNIATTSFAITTSSVGSRFNHVTQITTAAFVLTAAAVGSHLAYQTPIASASFAVTPSAISSLHHNKSVIDSASFALTPSAVGSLFNHKTLIESASFAVTPSAIGSLFNHSTPVASASFAITTSDITSTYNAGGGITTDTIDSATFAITPGTVGSLHHSVTQTASTAFTITTGAVGSLYSHKTLIESTVYALNPSSIGSLHNFAIQIASASFAITTSDVTSTYNSSATYGDVYNAVGYFTTGGTVTINLYDPITGASVSLSSDVCPEINATGLYIWDSTKLTTQPSSYQEYAWKMTNGTTYNGGVVIMGLTAAQIAEATRIEMDANSTRLAAIDLATDTLEASMVRVSATLTNKHVLNPADGTVKVYDDAGVLLYTGLAYSDAAGTVLYDGTAAVHHTTRLT